MIIPGPGRKPQAFILSGKDFRLTENLLLLFPFNGNPVGSAL
jgi:hypothetical protein